ncbi:MAG: HDIG domain-containing metalloprotein [Planctomycetota bacterium]
MARTPKTTKSKLAATKSARRRAEIRRTLGRQAFDIRSILDRPDLVNAVALLIVFVVATASLVTWSRQQPRVRDGQVMTETRVKRLDYAIIDEDATAERRDEVRESSPRVYILNENYLDRLQKGLSGLPTALANVESLDDVSPEIRDEFPLNEEDLTALRELGSDNVRMSDWNRKIGNLINVQLVESPLIRSEEYQVFLTQARTLSRTNNGVSTDESILGNAIELNSPVTPELIRSVQRIVARSNIPQELASFVARTIAADQTPTLLFDSERTEARANALAAQVEPVTVEHRAGEVLYTRGDLLTPAQYQSLLDEHNQYRANAPPLATWTARLGYGGLFMLLMGFAAAFVGQAYPRIARNLMRVAALCLLVLISLVILDAVSARVPSLLYPAAFATTLFVAVVVLVAYDQRLAVFIAAMQCAFAALSVNGGVALFVLLFAACGMLIAQLRELRHRNTLIRAAVVTAIGVGIGTFSHAWSTLPLVESAWGEIILRTLSSMTATAGVGFLLLGILPSIERWFDITTGMTLAELRDPRQPLLRQLQQKAPGTYNHSLQVASIAEAAADAIGADSLLVYVGALYHDIGKMNKPEYFIENQTPGANKHEGLSPAMSLLVIIGHVKDGIELAREYNLPRPIQHFIESHHGTTLVEYFFHAAKTQAESDEKASVEEVEFRYPGPKPHTREAACMMIADCVESATRALPEPNPARIESLVRDLSRKRLADGQLDECDLTFRELKLIQDAVISRVCAIHHGRIAYPSAEKPAVDDSRSSQTA